MKINVPRSGGTHRAIVVFPGYVMPGGTLGRAFAPYVTDDDAMIVVNYTERGFLGQFPNAVIQDSSRSPHVMAGAHDPRGRFPVGTMVIALHTSLNPPPTEKAAVA